MIIDNPYSNSSSQSAPPQVNNAQPPSQNRGFGNEFIGIGDYLKANRTATGNAMAGSGNASKEANQFTAKSAAERAEEQRQEAIASNSQNQALFNRAAGGGQLSDAEASQVKEYAKIINNPLTPLDQRASSASAMAALQSQKNNYASMNKSWLGQSVMGASGVNTAYQEDLKNSAAALDAEEKARQEAMANDAQMSGLMGSQRSAFDSTVGGLEDQYRMARQDADAWANAEYNRLNNELLSAAANALPENKGAGSYQGMVAPTKSGQYGSVSSGTKTINGTGDSRIGEIKRAMETIGKRAQERYAASTGRSGSILNNLYGLLGLDKNVGAAPGYEWVRGRPSLNIAQDRLDIPTR